MGTEERGLPPAGWYADPEGGAGRMRYWDGSTWTEHHHEGSAARGDGVGVRRFTALHVIASVYFVLGIAVAVLGGIGIVVAAIEQSDNPTRFDDAEPAAIVILGGLYIAFISLTLIAASAFIRLMLSVEESTRRTAAAVETLRSEREPEG